MADKVLLIVHQESSDPGRVGARLTGLGFELDIRRPACGDALPDPALEQHAGAVVFGGPMSANDEHLPFVRAEIDWIGRVAANGRPLFGICLGAQMLARAGGGAVGPHPDGWHEIGYYPLRATPAGRELFDDMHVFQWHGEGFEVPRSGTLLAAGEQFGNQAFRIGDNAYGVQFHPEVTRTMMQRWSTRAAHRLVLPGAQARDLMQQGWQRHDPALGRWLDRFLRRWLRLNEIGEASAAQ